MALPYTDLGPILAGPFGGTAALDAELGPSDLPLALFPVRLETRFFAAANGMAELRVRIYPDKVHIDSHDPALGADEAAWGRRFWELWRQAAGEAAGQRDAWRMLANRLGPERAAWVARALTPLDTGDGPPRFPDLGPPAEIARRALLRLLPERWTATAWARGGPPVTVDRPARPARPRRRPRPRRRRPAPLRHRARHRRRHPLDGRLRPRREGRHGAAPAPPLDPRRRQRRPPPRHRRPPRRRGRRARRPARRPPLRRRPRLRPDRHADQQHRRRPLRLRRPRPAAGGELRARVAPARRPPPPAPPPAPPAPSASPPSTASPTAPTATRPPPAP